MIPPVSPDPVEDDRLWSTVCPVWRTWATACYHAWECCLPEHRKEFPTQALTTIMNTLGYPENQWFRARFLIVSLVQLIQSEYMIPMATLEGKDALAQVMGKWCVYPSVEQGDVFLRSAEGLIQEWARPVFRELIEKLSLGWDLTNPSYEDADPVEATMAAGDALNAWSAVNAQHRDGYLHAFGMAILLDGILIFREIDPRPKA